jgi:O-antigen ligase
MFLRHFSKKLRREQIEMDSHSSNTKIRDAQGRGSVLGKAVTFRKSEVLSFSVAALYALVIAGYPFVSNFSTLADEHSRLYAVVLRAITVILSIFIIMFVGVKRKRFHGGLFLPFLAVFWVLYLARLVSDTIMIPVFMSLPRQEYFAYAVGGCLLPMLALMLRAGAKTIRRAFELTYGLSLAAILLVLVNTLVLNLDDTYWPSTGRLGTEALNPISLGHLATTLVVFSTYVLTRAQNMSVGGVVGNSVIMLTGLVVLVLTASRGPLLALMVTELILVFSVFRKGQMTRRNILVALLILIASVIASAHYLFVPGSEIGAHFNNRGEDTVKMRLEVLSAAWRSFAEAPLFGSGLELNEYGGYPHNVVLESFMATGIVGGTVFSILIFFTFMKALRVVRYSEAYCWVGLLFIQYIIGSLVSGALYSASTMWALMGAIIGVAGVRRRLHKQCGIAGTARPVCIENGNRI